MVTGASDGIGRAVATELAGRGLNVVLVARRRVELERLASALQATNGIEARVLPMDLARRGAAADLNAATSDLDVGLVVAAAGYGSSGLLVDAELADEMSMLDLNCGSVLALAHGFGQRLSARGRGGMMLFGSLVGWQGVPNAANYAATKAYVQSLAEGLRAELGKSGVDVLSVAPGPVRSGFEARAKMEMGSAQSPEKVARTAVATLGRRGTSVPGTRSKLLTWSLAPLPRSVRVAIMGRIMASMAGERGGGTEVAA